MLLVLLLYSFLFQAKGRDRAAEQLSDYAKTHQGTRTILRTSFGGPIADKMNALTVGPRGPMLLQDIVFLDEMAHFDRERIPERVVHAKGAGAFGTFEVTRDITRYTRDITRYTRANLFGEIGKKTPVAVRFSLGTDESGAADTVRDMRGFAVKFYTEEGNWDLVGSSIPIFFVRDPLLVTSLVHAIKRNPVTHLKDADMAWDFLSLRPETTNQLMWLYADSGIPDGYRHMRGFGVHAFKLVNAVNEAVYCKFSWEPNQGVKNLPVDVAQELAASDPDYAIRDLYNAIASGDYPSWTLYIQVMTFEQARTWEFNPFDLTKMWPVEDFPLIEVGQLTLTRNPTNYFSQVEQIAFSPASMVPGIEPSPDKMLQGRLFAYLDTQRYRLGTNFQQIPVNCPYRAIPSNYERDGQQTINHNQDGAPNYYPNSFSGPVEDSRYRLPAVQVSGDVDRWNSTNEDNFTQARLFYRERLGEEERLRVVRSIAADLSEAREFIQERQLNNFRQVDLDFGNRIKAELDSIKAQRSAGQTLN